MTVVPIFEPAPAPQTDPEADPAEARRASQRRRFSGQRRLSAALRAVARAVVGLREQRLLHPPHAHEARVHVLDAAGLAGDVAAPSAQQAAILLDGVAVAPLYPNECIGKAERTLDEATVLLLAARDEIEPPQERLLRGVRILRLALGLDGEPGGSYEDEPDAVPPDHVVRNLCLAVQDNISDVDRPGVEKAIEDLRDFNGISALVSLEEFALRLRRD